MSKEQQKVANYDRQRETANYGEQQETAQGTANYGDLMTEGPVRQRIIRFAIPVFIGNLFQQLYNTVDSLIVGNFEGSGALAAVSSVGNLVFLLIGFFNGIAIGAGVVIAHYIGARKQKETELAVHTAVAVGLLCSAAMTILGVLLTPLFLQWMGTPDSVMADSVTYLRIYFAGVAGLIMYNTFVGILQAAGDSRHPLYYLIFSSGLNIILDLVLIAGLRMGVAGAALATVISQLLSAFLSMGRLMRTNEVYRLRLRSICLNRMMVWKIVRIGIPSGLQNSIIGLSNVVIQSYINSYGEMAMAGIGAYCKIEGFAFLPVTSFAMALTTFVSQNLGANEKERVDKGVHFGVLCGLILAELVGLTLFLFSPQLVAAFDRTPEVIQYGVARARIVTPFFFLCAYTHIMAAILRGAGHADVPMVIFLVCWCAIRIVIIAGVGMVIRTINITYWVYPITWVMSSAALFVYWNKEKGKLKPE